MALPGIPSLGFVEMSKINPNPPGINPTYVVTLGACTREVVVDTLSRGRVRVVLNCAVVLCFSDFCLVCQRAKKVVSWVCERKGVCGQHTVGLGCLYSKCLGVVL